MQKKTIANTQHASAAKVGSSYGDWQVDSMLLFAERTSFVLGGQLPGSRSSKLSAPSGEAWEQDRREAAQQRQQIEQLLCKLVSKFIDTAQSYYKTGIDYVMGEKNAFGFKGVGFLNEPKHIAEQREYVTSIGEEWSRLMSLVATARFFASESPDRALLCLQKVIELAKRDLNLQVLESNLREQLKRQQIDGQLLRDLNLQFAVLPHFGRHFELVKFKYAPGIFVIGIPVTSLYCPWDWPVIWHELAGVYIEAQRCLGFGVVHEVHQALSPDAAQNVWPQLWEVYGAQLAGLPGEDDQAISEPQPPADFVRHTWAEELVEDAVGVLCLGESMVASLEAILHWHYADSEIEEMVARELSGVPDTRHPPRALRIAVAEQLVRCMQGQVEAVPDEPVAVLAQVMWQHRDDLVTTFKDSANRLQAGAGEDGIIADDELRLMVAEVTGAFYKRKQSGEELRQRVYSDKLSHTWEQGVSELPVPFESFQFSEVDQLTAVPEGQYIHDHNPAGDNLFKFRLHGAAPHDQSHNGIFEVRHRHDPNTNLMTNHSVTVRPKSS